MSNDERREHILQIALTTFGQYGYRRTTMGDLADAAGISRPALYLLFRNKEDVFRSCSAWLQEGALLAARRALEGDSPFPDRLMAAVQERFTRLHARFYPLPHAAELLDLNGTIAADITLRVQQETRDALAQAVALADVRGELSLARVGLSAVGWADLLLASLYGLKATQPDPLSLPARTHALLTVFCAAICAPDANCGQPLSAAGEDSDPEGQ